MAVDPYSDGSGAWPVPALSYGLSFKDYGSYGLRQYGGWVREEFLPQLVGREAARVYREMLDNSSTIGSMMFAITQAMRKVAWRVDPANDKAEAKREAEFADSLRQDMSHTWEDFVVEALSMLGYGYSIHELVYKKRLGEQKEDQAKPGASVPSSKFNDGRIGWRRLPIRAQDTVIKWFFDANGQVRGVTQQPWIGPLIDIPIAKFLLFRPTQHKNNPEGRSVLRNAYRSYYFIKRLEELEAILFERMSGFPLMRVPNSLLEQATATNPNTQAVQALAAYKKLVTNVRIDEQMGAILPSDTYMDADGKRSTVKMYDFELLTPQHGRSSVDADKTINRYKLDTLMTLLCDFITMGHEVRGTNNLGVTKVDMFYAAIEGWLTSLAEVINRYALPRLWQMNALNRDLMPRFVPDMPQRLDLDGLGGFIANLASAGMAFTDDETQSFLRDAAGLPEIESPEAVAVANGSPDVLKRMLRAAIAKRVIVKRQLITPIKRTLYISRRLQNADSIIAWAREQGFASTLSPSDMHVTVAFSRAPVDWGKAGTNEAGIVAYGDKRGLERLGDKGAVVLRFDDVNLQRRHADLRNIGASWDWPSYKPHVTLTYDASDLDLENVKPFDGQLLFGPERFAEVDEGWVDRIQERAA